MQRATLPATERIAAVALRTPSLRSGRDVLTRTLREEPDAMVREHAACALEQRSARPASRRP